MPTLALAFTLTLTLTFTLPLTLTLAVTLGDEGQSDDDEGRPGDDVEDEPRADAPGIAERAETNGEYVRGGQEEGS